MAGWILTWVHDILSCNTTIVPWADAKALLVEFNVTGSSSLFCGRDNELHMQHENLCFLLMVMTATSLMPLHVWRMTPFLGLSPYCAAEVTWQAIQHRTDFVDLCCIFQCEVAVVLLALHHKAFALGHWSYFAVTLVSFWTALAANEPIEPEMLTLLSIFPFLVWR